MNSLPLGTQLEFKYRLTSNASMIKMLSDGKAIPERKAWSYNALANSYFNRGVILQLLGENETADGAFNKVIPEAKNAIAYDLYENDDNRQYVLFIYALLLCDKNQADESASIIAKLGVSQSRLNAPSEVYLALASLWLEKKDAVQALLPNIERIEQKKNEKYIKPGFVRTLKGILDKNLLQAIDGVNQLLEGHKHEAKYMKTALHRKNFICEQVTILCILALRYGVDLKSEIEGEVTILKTKMESPIDRPEIPEKTKFEVPVDLIPEWVLAPWRKEFKNELNN